MQSTSVRTVYIPAGGVVLTADLVSRAASLGVVLFSHGSGSSRFSPRNRHVAGALQQAGFTTLLLDLLTESEETDDARTGRLRFAVPLLAARLGAATDWVTQQAGIADGPLGYFGASTGAAAALIAAADRPEVVRAVVSRGGRPDLAVAALPHVTAPTLLIVGGEDDAVVELNREALETIGGEKDLRIVAGASHLFEEPGALDEVTGLARDWFERHLVGRPYRDRAEAGRILAARLARYRGRRDVVVLALPRGGVPVGEEVARALDAPLDVVIVRKLGVHAQPELALGAIASGGVRVLNEELVQALSIPHMVIDAVASREQNELERRERRYRDDRPPFDVGGRVVIVVDDGLATGATMRAAVVALRRRKAARVVVAVPTASRAACEALRAEADEVVCATTPEPFYAVGQWYQDFSQTTDLEVREALGRAAARRRRAA
jgi:predicted phosphoribosyltransferase/dienelactone hydrolase